jgi:hypothetical protein
MTRGEGAYRWDSGIANAQTGAARDLNEAYVRCLAVLAFLSPKLVRAIRKNARRQADCDRRKPVWRNRPADTRTRLHESRASLTSRSREDFDKQELARRDAPTETAKKSC